MKLSRVGVVTEVVALLSSSVASLAFTPRNIVTGPTRWNKHGAPSRARACSLLTFAAPQNPEDDITDEDGANLAAEFFKTMSERDISLDDDEQEFTDEDYEDFTGDLESSDDSDDEIDFPQGAINAFTGLDRGEPGDKLSGETSLTNQQIYDEVKERVLESAGGFVALTKGVDNDDDIGALPPDEKYTPPVKIPDSGLTAGEVVMTVLSALRHNDDPHPDRGVEILFGYSSPGSQITELIETEMLTPAEYREFLYTSEDNIALFEHEKAIIDKAEFSPDRLKAYLTARLLNGSSSDGVSVNFILSTSGTDEDDCWLIDSMLIRPSKLRRRRRR